MLEDMTRNEQFISKAAEAAGKISETGFGKMSQITLVRTLTEGKCAIEVQRAILVIKKSR